MSAKSAAFSLAQRSLVALLGMTVVSSCIVADPPTYTDPVQTRPALNAFLATPVVFQQLVIQLPATTAPTFTVPVQSEDNGERLFANFFLDYQAQAAKASLFPLGEVNVPPASFNDDTDRSITFVWSGVNTPPPGCHTLTMIVAHESTYVLNTSTPDRALALKDAALMTWWLNLLPDPTITPPPTLVPCPSQQAQ